jgi:hypothetical protein
MSDAIVLGNKLVAMCKEGQNVACVQELYADDVVSVEAADGPGGPRELVGKEAVAGKNTWWIENHEVHSAKVEGPFPHGTDQFAVLFDYDVTSKPMKQRMQMKEVAVYTVANGKIAREQFFYNMG